MIEIFRNGFYFTGRALGFLSTEVQNMHAAAYILAIASLLSSLLALLRDRVLASSFGAGPELDLYYAAFRIPDLIFVSIGALVSAYVLIPVLASRDQEAQKRYIDTVIVGFSVLAITAATIAAIATPRLLQWFFPTLVAGGDLTILTTLTRILLLQPIFLGFSNIFAAITQSRHRYMLYALSPIVYNVGIIFGAVVLYPTYGLPGLVWGVVIGALLHVGIQIPGAIGDGFFRNMPRFYEPTTFSNTVGVSIPRALALSMGQIAYFGLTVFLASLAAGSISVFTFAYNMQGVPLMVIGASYSVAAFPTLARMFATNGVSAFRDQVMSAARQIIFWSLPIIALLIILRAHIVRAVLGAGEFDWTDTRLTAAALALFSVSIVAQGMTLLLIRACYAAGKTLAPFIVTTITAACTLLLGFIFLQMFAHSETAAFLQIVFRVENVPGSDMLALVLAYTAASMIGTLLLGLYFEAQFGDFFSSVARAWWEGLTAALIAGGAAYLTLHVIGDVTLSSTLGSILLKGGTAGVIGIFFAALSYYLLGNIEFAENVEALKRRVWRQVEPVSSAE